MFLAEPVLPAVRAGVVVAVLGVEQADGEFAVEAVLLPDLPPQPLRPPAPAPGEQQAGPASMPR